MEEAISFQERSAIAEIKEELSAQDSQLAATTSKEQQINGALEQVIAKAKLDQPMWLDWQTFWQRCLELVQAITLT